MESLVSAALHQIRLRPCVKGSCLFLSSFSLSKGQTSGPRSVPSSLLSHIIYGYSTIDGHGKGPDYALDIRMRGCSRRQMAFLHGSKREQVRSTVAARKEIYEKVHKEGEAVKKKLWSLWDLKHKSESKNTILAKDSLAQQMLTGCFSFPPQLRGCWNKSVSNSELMWNTWWSVTAWVMTVLSSYKLHSQFDNSNGVLPGQIFVRCEGKLYVKLYDIYRM